MGVRDSGRSNRGILETGAGANREMVLRKNHQLDKEYLMKKYAILVLCILCGVCFALAYRLGGANCRKDIAEETATVQQMAERHVQGIKEKILSTDSADNLDWLRKHWKRAD